MGILEDTLIPKFTPPEDAFMWATVTQASPLRVKLDGESSALSVTPVDLVGSLALNDRVWVQLHGHRLVVIGKPGGGGAQPTIGMAAYGQQTDDTGLTSSSTTHVDVVTASSFTAPSGRLYKISIQFNMYSSVSGDLPGLVIKEGSTTLRSSWAPVLSTSDSVRQLFMLHAPSAGSHTFKAAFFRAQGSGTVTVFCSTGEPAIILVEDIGSA